MTRSLVIPARWPVEMGRQDLAEFLGYASTRAFETDRRNGWILDPTGSRDPEGKVPTWHRDAVEAWVAERHGQTPDAEAAVDGAW